MEKEGTKGRRQTAREAEMNSVAFSMHALNRLMANECTVYYQAFLA